MYGLFKAMFALAKEKSFRNLLMYSVNANTDWMHAFIVKVNENKVGAITSELQLTRSEMEENV